MLAQLGILVGLLASPALGAPRCRTNAECLKAGLPLLRPRLKGNGLYGRDLPDCIATWGYAGSIQSCVISQTGVYTISAAGAQGGHDAAYPSFAGGFGTLASGQGFTFSAGEILQIAVGGAGGVSSSAQADAGGGGGGSFVYQQLSSTTFSVLVVGGGGGGSAWDGMSGGNAPLAPDATYTAGSGNPQGGNPGTNGQGGENGGTGDGSGGGGAGVFSNGGTDPTRQLQQGGNDILSGLGGGQGNDPDNGNKGGFGGGGGGNYYAGGGGGGYSGGPGGSAGFTDSGGGGGSSFVISQYNTTVTPSYSQYTMGGNGLITITRS